MSQLKEKSTTKCLDFRQVNRLISICKENGVSEIEYRGLHLKFEKVNQPLLVKEVSNSRPGVTPEQLIEQDNLDQLLLTDPSAFFNEMESGGITSVGDGASED